MGGFISPATLEQIRAASEIVDVIGSYLPLKKAGANFVALCPFHKEKTPSFHVNPHKQFFHCYGCHKGGDVFTFVKEYESIDFPDAVRRLAERARIPIETEASPAGAVSRHLKDQLLSLHEQITRRWQAALGGEGGKVARDYLERRGVPPEAIELFRIGYAPEAWDDTVNWAKGKAFDLTLCEQAGLVVRKEGADHYYDRFRGRLIFPICDEQGRVVAFSGRILTDEKVAKYVNSPETPIFTKGKVMFGLDKSKRALLESRRAVICEGQLDLIRCFMSGVNNIVAPQGTALTADHARLLKRYAEEVVLCFDSDNAGQNAAVRSLDSLLAAGLAVRVAAVPAPHDPDSFIREAGPAAFVELIAKARGFFDYYLDRLCALHDPATDRGRAAIVQAMAEAAGKTGSDVLIDSCAQKTAMRIGVAMDAVRSEFRKKGRPADGPGEEAAAVHERPRLTEQERWLLRLMLESDRHIEWIAAHLELEWLPTATAREIAAQRLQAEEWPGLAGWFSQLDNPPWQSLITEMMADARAIQEEAALLQGVGKRDGILKILRDKHIDRRVAAISLQLADPNRPETEHGALLQELQQLRRMKQQPLAPRGDESF